MADIGYNQGIADVMPQTQAPDDYQNVQSKVGAAVSGFGDAAADTAKFFGTVAADNAFNEYQDVTTKILRGDPNKTTIGPDGQPVQDTGYYGLQGRAALDARPQVQQQLDDALKEIEGGLRTPQQLAQFESYSRRYRASTFTDIGNHANTEAQGWYKQVNGISAQNAIDAISSQPLDTATVLTSAADLTNAYTKQAQIDGATPGDPIWQEAILRARQDAFKAQVRGVGATDPSRAVNMLQKSQALAGTDYPTLYSDLKNRADAQDALSLATGATTGAVGKVTQDYAASLANPAQPIYRTAVTEMPGGMSPNALARTVQIESNGHADVVNASGHTGLGQFSAATWKLFGAGGDPKNPDDAIRAIQRYAVANSNYLTPRLGREPTDAELYLAHQQGPRGAALLLTHPDASAVSLLGRDAVIRNHGTASMTAAQYAAMWTRRFNAATPGNIVTGTDPVAPRQSFAPTTVAGGPAGPQSVPAGGIPASPDDVGRPAAPVPLAPLPSGNDRGSASASPDGVPNVAPASAPPLSSKAAAFQAIAASDASPEVKQRAYALASQQLATQAAMDDATAAQRRQLNDQAANGYMTQILKPGADISGLMGQVAEDQSLDWQTKQSLSSAIISHAGESVSAASAVYGPGFFSLYQQVTAGSDSPSRVSDVGTILRRAGQGGDLTLVGAQKLIDVLGQMKRSPDDAAINTTKTSLLAYAKSKISADTTGMPLVPGMAMLHDAQGEMLFNSRFVPKFEAAYDKWVGAGKNPWEFLTQENVDKLATGVRSPHEMAMAKLMAQQTGIDASQLQAPPAPAGIDEDSWHVVVNLPPIIAAGKPISMDGWSKALQLLVAQPTRTQVDHLNRAMGPDAAFDAQSILDALGVPIRDPASPDDRQNILLPLTGAAANVEHAP
jgi:hypothetical protein